jgi:hypothetical protein
LQKYRGLMNFLSNVLREDGGFEYKKAIVDAILVLIRDIPEAKEMGLAQLCEFIEDCEFTFLSVQILHLLGDEGPRTKEPGGPDWTHSVCLYMPVCVCLCVCSLVCGSALSVSVCPCDGKPAQLADPPPALTL